MSLSPQSPQMVNRWKAVLFSKVKRFSSLENPVLPISDEYPGLWLESAPYDGLQFVRLLGGDPAVAEANINCGTHDFADERGSGSDSPKKRRIPIIGSYPPNREFRSNSLPIPKPASTARVATPAASRPLHPAP